MKIQLFDDYYLTKFDLTENYQDYIQVLEKNAQYLHAVEMDHIAFHESGELFKWLTKVEADGLWNFLIYKNKQIIGRVSIYKVFYDQIPFASLSIFLDHSFQNLGIMSCAITKVLALCETHHVQNLLWEAKTINDRSNHLAVKLNFKFWKQVKIDPKRLNPNWTCEFYNLYLKK